MPSVQHVALVEAPFPTVWQFVKTIGNWAPLVTGYQSHEEISESESIWFLKGELGGLTRVAEFKAIVQEWDEAHGRVRFTLEGVNEPVTGEGTFLAEQVPPVGKDVDEVGAVATDMAAKSWRSRLAWFFYRLIFRNSPTARSQAAASGPVRGTGTTRMTFDLSLNGTGMSGRLLNMLITPMLQPVAHELAEGIARRIENDN